MQEVNQDDNTIKMGRHVDNVIDIILQIIPNDNIKLITELITYKKNELWNKSPEALKSRECWYPFIQILNNNIQEIKEAWQIQIRDYLLNNL